MQKTSAQVVKEPIKRRTSAVDFAGEVANFKKEVAAASRKLVDKQREAARSAAKPSVSRTAKSSASPTAKSSGEAAARATASSSARPAVSSSAKSAAKSPTRSAAKAAPAKPQATPRALVNARVTKKADGAKGLDAKVVALGKANPSTGGLSRSLVRKSPQPVATADVKAETKVGAKVDAKVDVKAEAKVVAKVDGKVDVKADIKVEVEPKTSAVESSGPTVRPPMFGTRGNARRKARSASQQRSTNGLTPRQSAEVKSTKNAPSLTRATTLAQATTLAPAKASTNSSGKASLADRISASKPSSRQTNSLFKTTSSHDETAARSESVTALRSTSEKSRFFKDAYGDAAKTDAAEIDAAKNHASKTDAAKIEAAKNHAAKVEAAKNAAAKNHAAISAALLEREQKFALKLSELKKRNSKSLLGASTRNTDKENSARPTASPLSTSNVRSIKDKASAKNGLVKRSANSDNAANRAANKAANKAASKAASKIETQPAKTKKTFGKKSLYDLTDKFSSKFVTQLGGVDKVLHRTFDGIAQKFVTNAGTPDDESKPEAQFSGGTKSRPADNTRIGVATRVVVSAVVVAVFALVIYSVRQSSTPSGTAPDKSQINRYLLASNAISVPAWQVIDVEYAASGALERVAMKIGWPVGDEVVQASNTIVGSFIAQRSQLSRSSVLASLTPDFFEDTAQSSGDIAARAVSGGFAGKRFRTDSIFAGHVLYTRANSAMSEDDFVLCSQPEGTSAQQAICFSEAQIADGLVFSYSFSGLLIPQWTEIDQEMRKIATSYVVPG